MYEQWSRDPQSVHSSWKEYFESASAAPSQAESDSSNAALDQILELIKGGAGAV
jgi:2-oxoglutarate dehydrogenase complex dehydrogenase (E1) component-like enzyme